MNNFKSQSEKSLPPFLSLQEEQAVTTFSQSVTPPLDLGNKVVDTSGAGDAFNGAFATALCEDKNIKDSLIFANTFAGISTTRVGTAKSMPTREEIDKLL